jgi:hypothetical protein
MNNIQSSIKDYIDNIFNALREKMHEQKNNIGTYFKIVLNIKSSSISN